MVPDPAQVVPMGEEGRRGLQGWWRSMGGWQRGGGAAGREPGRGQRQEQEVAGPAVPSQWFGGRGRRSATREGAVRPCFVMEDAVQRHDCSSSSVSSFPSVHPVAAQLQVHNLIEPHLPFAFRGAIPLPGCRRSLPAAKAQARRRQDLIRSNGGDGHGAKYWVKRDEALILSVKSNGGDGHGAEYWGKRDEALILPVNDNINIILDPDHLSATPTVTDSPSFPSDRMWLNGKEIALSGGRFLHV